MIYPVDRFSLDYIINSSSKTFGIIFSNKAQKEGFLKKIKSQSLEYKISHFAGRVFELRILDKIVIEFKRALPAESICGWRIEELFIDVDDNDSEDYKNFIKSMISVKPRKTKVMNVGDLCPFCGQEFLVKVEENIKDVFSSEHLACGLCNSTYNIEEIKE